MRKTITTLAALLLALSLMAGPAAARGHGPPDFDTPHSHVLLLHADVEARPGQSPPYQILGYGKCVDLAGGEALRHNRHHTNIHFGRAGQALRGAGHLVVPFFDCATLDGFFQD